MDENPTSKQSWAISHKHQDPTTSGSLTVPRCGGIISGFILLYERPPKPPTIRNSFTRTLVPDSITKPSGMIGDTQKTMKISATSFRGCNRFSPLLIIWVFPKIGVFPPKSSILIGFSMKLTIHFGVPGYPYFWKHPYHRLQFPTSD